MATLCGDCVHSCGTSPAAPYASDAGWTEPGAAGTAADAGAAPTTAGPGSNSERDGEKGERRSPSAAQARHRASFQAGLGIETVRRQDQRKHTLPGCDQEGGRNREACPQREREDEGAIA